MTAHDVYQQGVSVALFLKESFAFWAGLSIVINVLLRVKSAEKWVDSARATRGGAWAIGLLETWGIDPVPGIKLTAAFVAGRAAQLSGHDHTIALREAHGASLDHDAPPASGGEARASGGGPQGEP